MGKPTMEDLRGAFRSATKKARREIVVPKPKIVAPKPEKKGAEQTAEVEDVHVCAVRHRGLDDEGEPHKVLPGLRKGGRAGE